MGLFSEIQNDILSEVSISSILRKAKVLAFRLNSQELKEWVECELNGYKDQKDYPLPDYRKFRSPIFGDFMNTAWKHNNAPIPIGVFPETIQEMISLIEMREGVKELESMHEKLNASTEAKHYRFLLPPELISQLHNVVYENMGCLSAWRMISSEQIAQILDTIRNSLLSFVLELSNRYPDDVNSDFGTRVSIPEDQIRQVFNIYILGDNPSIVGTANEVLQGVSMSIFDQRNQNVEYQYNAANDINFETVTNLGELSRELGKLIKEIQIANEKKVIENEIAKDAEIKIQETIQQTKKPKPDKESMLKNLKGVIAVLKGIAEAAGLVNALIKAAELIDKLI